MTHSATVEEFEIRNEDGYWLVNVEVEFDVDPGFPPWKGGMYSCPSDADFYGQDAAVEYIESVVVTSVYDMDDEAEVALCVQARRVIADHISENLDEDALIESIPEDEGDCRW